MTWTWPRFKMLFYWKFGCGEVANLIFGGKQKDWDFLTDAQKETLARASSDSHIHPMLVLGTVQRAILAGELHWDADGHLLKADGTPFFREK